MTKQTGVLRRYHSWLAVSQRFLDSLTIFILLPALCALKGDSFGIIYQTMAVMGVLLAWIVMGTLNVYRPWRGATLLSEVRLIVGAWLVVVASLIFIVWMMKFSGNYSRLLLGSWFVAVPFVLASIHITERTLLRMLRISGRNSRTAVIVGAGDLGVSLAQSIINADWMGVKIVGFFDDDEKKKEQSLLGIPVRGSSSEALEFISLEKVDQVYLSLPMESEKRIQELFGKLQDCTTSVFFVPDLFMFELMGTRVQEIAGIPVFSLCESPITGPFGVFKWAEDIVLSTLILLLIWPVLLTIALGIKLSSGGPVIFKQHRYGLNGKLIKVYKFRTMTVCEDGAIVKQATESDERVTLLGNFLRRTSLDELPQFINVLQGRMSIVGPRPHAVAHNEQYRKLIKGYMWRHKVKPGITGWAQINGWRGETETLEKMKGRVRYDLDYIRNWSAWLDIKIILLTIIKGFKNNNA